MDSLLNWVEQLGPEDILYWLMAALLLALVIGIGNVIKYFGRRFFQTSRSEMIWKRIINLIILFIGTLFLFSYLSESDWMVETLFVLGDTNITPLLIVSLLFAVIIALNFSKVFRENILTNVYLKYNVEIGVQATINTLLHYSIVLLVVFFALNSLGFSLTSLTVFTGVLGVGIGFGLQNIMNNFVSGLIILFDRPIKVGDRVIVDKTIIDIEKIKIRNTIGHTRKNERIIIPNSFFLEEKFINRSYSDKRLQISVALSVPYGSNLHVATDLIKEAVVELSETKWQKALRRPEPKVFVEEFNDYDISMTVWFWIDNQANEFEFIIPSDLRYLIYDKFNKNGVEFSFPRQDVYLMNDNEKEKNS